MIIECENRTLGSIAGDGAAVRGGSGVVHAWELDEILGHWVARRIADGDIIY